MSLVTATPFEFGSSLPRWGTGIGYMHSLDVENGDTLHGNARWGIELNYAEMCGAGGWVDGAYLSYNKVFYHAFSFYGLDFPTTTPMSPYTIARQPGYEASSDILALTCLANNATQYRLQAHMWDNSASAWHALGSGSTHLNSWEYVCAEIAGGVAGVAPYIRVWYWTGGAWSAETAALNCPGNFATITNISATNPGIITAAGHGFNDGDRVALWGVPAPHVGDMLTITLDGADPTNKFHVGIDGGAGWSGTATACSSGDAVGAVGSMTYGFRMSQPDFSPRCTEIGSKGSSSIKMRYCNWQSRDDQGSKFNTKPDIKDRTVVLLPPNADGAEGDFTPDGSPTYHFHNVDDWHLDPSCSPGGSLDGNANGEKELIGFNWQATKHEGIDAVIPTFQGSASVVDVKGLASCNGAQVESANLFGVGYVDAAGTLGIIAWILKNTPEVTPGDWDDTKVAAAEAGASIKAASKTCVIEQLGLIGVRDSGGSGNELQWPTAKRVCGAAAARRRWPGAVV